MRHLIGLDTKTNWVSTWKFCPPQRVGGEWYKGTADAIYQNLDIIRTHKTEYILVLSGDFSDGLWVDDCQRHRTGADMTISVEVPLKKRPRRRDVGRRGCASSVSRKPTADPDSGDPGAAGVDGTTFSIPSFYTRELIADARIEARLRQGHHSLVDWQEQIFATLFGMETVNAHTGAMSVISMPSGPPTWSYSA